MKSFKQNPTLALIASTAVVMGLLALAGLAHDFHGRSKTVATKPLAGWVVIIPDHESLLHSQDIGGYVGRAIFEELTRQGAEMISTEESKRRNPKAEMQMSYSIIWISEKGNDLTANTQSYEQPESLIVKLNVGSHTGRAIVDQADIKLAPGANMSMDELRENLATSAAQNVIGAVAER